MNKVNDDNNKNRQSTMLSWLAILISVSALFLAYVAFNRSGKNLMKVVDKELDQATQEVEREWDEAVIETRIAALRARIEARQNLDQVADEIAVMRQDVQSAYVTVNQETREQLQELDADLELLEEQVRNNSAEAIGTLEMILEDLRRDVRTDEE